MLESHEVRAKLRRKLETWPEDRQSPVTINQALELLDLVERLEKEADWLARKLETNVPLLHEDAGWREAASEAVKVQNDNS